MNTLRSKYKELRAREINIKGELREAKKMPRLEVLHWLDEVENLRNQAKNIEKGRSYISKYHLRFSARMLSKKMDQLQKACHFPKGLSVSMTVIVDECPERSQLLSAIWGNLMDPSVGIISIYGSAGVGKTTAMKNIRNQLSASDDTFDSIFWVSVSKASNLRTVQNDIAVQMRLDLPYQSQRRTLFLESCLQKVGKFIIIFDDLWEPISLWAVGLPPLQQLRACGCKIVLISRDFDVCRKMGRDFGVCRNNMGSDKFIRIDPFSWTEKWSLFVEKAGNTVQTPEIRPLARQLVEICPGLPFIVTSLGHAMGNETSVEAWRDVLVYLTHASEGMVSNLLRICYNRLKNEITQNCFLYCALFAEGHLFKSEDLIRYWIGESFIQQDGDLVTQTDAGYKIIRKLVDSNMLEKFTESGDDMLKMPNLCRNMAITVMKEKPRLWLNAPPGYQISVRDLAEYRKISVVINFETPNFLWDPSCNIWYNVSTLLIRYSSIFCTPIPLSETSALRFLDLSHSHMAKLPTSISRLAQLRVLLLRDCSRLNNIPSLEKMEELQILNLKGTSITELPQGMERMVRLRSLDLSETKKLENIRVGLISSLSGLEELRMQGSGVCKMNSPMVVNYLMEMRGLKRLAILSISTVRYDDLLDTIMCLQGQNLQVYSINLYGSTDDYSEDV